MAVSKKDKLKAIHSKSILEFNKVQTELKDEREQCLEDRRFYSIPGAQWEGPLESQFENKPRYEVNRVNMAVAEVVGEYRNNRVSVDFEPHHGTGDSAADACDAVFRADERDSNAKEAYDNAFEEGVGGGFGAWRLTHDYEDEYDSENDHQRIKIEPIYDADSCVYCDQNATRQDKADAKRAWVLYSMTHDAYEEQWGIPPSTMTRQVEGTEFDWCTKEAIYVADFYEIEEVSETFLIFKNELGEEKKVSLEEYEDEENDLDLELEVQGFEEIRRRKVKSKKVHKYIIDGKRVLEDCSYIGGKNIPIVPFYGKRWFIDNTERCMGIVRLAKDAQRLKNMQLSKVASLTAMTGYEKPIVMPEQYEGLQHIWENDNNKDYPVLMLNPLEDAEGNPIYQGPVDYLRAPQIPPSLIGLHDETSMALDEILGRSKADEEVRSNVSGKTMAAYDKRSDKKNLIYNDNFARAMQRSGEIYLSMSADIYVERERKLTALKKEGRGSYEVEIMKPMIDENGEEYFENDFASMKMRVSAEVCPMTSTQREEVVQTMMKLLPVMSDPEDQKIVSSTIMRNMNGPGMSALREKYRKTLVQLGAEDPTEEDIAEMEAQQAQAAQQGQAQNVQDEYFKSETQLNEIKAMKGLAEIEETKADTAKKQSETVENYAGIERDDFKAASEMMNNGIRPAASMGEF